MALLVFAIIGGGIVLGLRYREQAKEAADARPSIVEFSSADLPEYDSASAGDPSMSDGSDVSGDVAGSEDSPSRPDDPETIAVSVLNGGAAGGSAGKVTTYLQSKGYKKAKAGNTNGSNVGIVVYYSEDMEDEAKVLQLVLLDSYKGVTASPAKDAKNKDATSAPIVVILGS